jgi:hypothetical protein
MILGMSGARPTGAAAARIEAWVRSQFDLADDAVVMVTELRCTEPDCPPLETVIAILEAGAPPRQARIHAALADVGDVELHAARWA